MKFSKETYRNRVVRHIIHKAKSVVSEGHVAIDLGCTYQYFSDTLIQLYLKTFIQSRQNNLTSKREYQLQVVGFMSYCF